MKFASRLSRLWILFRYSGTEYARRSGVKVGDNCRIITKYFGTEPFLIRIGSRVTVADGVRFLTHDGAHWLVRDDRGRRFQYGRIEIGDDVFVGAGAILMPGVRIGSRCIVAAGAVVTRSVPDGTIVAGVPARIIGDFNRFETQSLATAPAEHDRQQGSDFEEWVLSVTERNFRPNLSAKEKLIRS